jgi:hypothetical protein
MAKRSLFAARPLFLFVALTWSFSAFVNLAHQPQSECSICSWQQLHIYYGVARTSDPREVITVEFGTTTFFPNTICLSSHQDKGDLKVSGVVFRQRVLSCLRSAMQNLFRQSSLENLVCVVGTVGFKG